MNDVREAFCLLGEWCDEHGIIIERWRPWQQFIVSRTWYVKGVIHNTRCRITMVGPHHFKITNDCPDSEDLEQVKKWDVYTYNMANPKDWEKFCVTFGVDNGCKQA